MSEGLNCRIPDRPTLSDEVCYNLGQRVSRTLVRLCPVTLS